MTRENKHVFPMGITRVPLYVCGFTVSIRFIHVNYRFLPTRVNIHPNITYHQRVAHVSFLLGRNSSFVNPESTMPQVHLQCTYRPKYSKRGRLSAGKHKSVISTNSEKNLNAATQRTNVLLRKESGSHFV